jgi:hypothetical protein
MSLATPPSLNLSTVLPSTAAAATPGGNTLPRDISGAVAPRDMLLCPPGGAAAEQALLVGSGIACAP